jgi:hypothetical protein
MGKRLEIASTLFDSAVKGTIKGLRWGLITGAIVIIPIGIYVAGARSSRLSETPAEIPGESYFEYLDLDENCLYDVTRRVFEKEGVRNVRSVEYHPEFQLTKEQALSLRGINIRTRFFGCPP